LVWEHMVSDTRKQIEAKIIAFKLEIERLKSLAKKRMGQPRDLEDVTRQLRELHVRLSQLERNWRQTN
jgi:predicted FMN-binding regulatory protein PaiB